MLYILSIHQASLGERLGTPTIIISAFLGNFFFDRARACDFDVPKKAEIIIVGVALAGGYGALRRSL